MGVFDSLRSRKVWDVFRKLQKMDALVEYCLTFIWLVCKQNCDKIFNAASCPSIPISYGISLVSFVDHIKDYFLSGFDSKVIQGPHLDY